MIMKSENNGIEEVNNLINQLDISGSDATEIINIYLECYSDAWTYEDFLRDEIRIIRKSDENMMDAIAELSTVDDALIFEGDDYYMITNYQTLIRMGEIKDFLPNHSF